MELKNQEILSFIFSRPIDQIWRLKPSRSIPSFPIFGSKFDFSLDAYLGLTKMWFNFRNGNYCVGFFLLEKKNYFCDHFFDRYRALLKGLFLTMKAFNLNCLDNVFMRKKWIWDPGEAVDWWELSFLQVHSFFLYGAIYDTMIRSLDILGWFTLSLLALFEFFGCRLQQYWFDLALREIPPYLPNWIPIRSCEILSVQYLKLMPYNLIKLML